MYGSDLYKKIQVIFVALRRYYRGSLMGFWVNLEMFVRLVRAWKCLGEWVSKGGWIFHGVLEGGFRLHPGKSESNHQILSELHQSTCSEARIS